MSRAFMMVRNRQPGPSKGATSPVANRAGAGVQAHKARIASILRGPPAQQARIAVSAPGDALQHEDHYIADTIPRPERLSTTRGHALPLRERAFFEPRLGHDLRDVRIHTDPPAAETARALSAHAYTRDNHIVFAPRRYAPETHAGRHLLAHELVHVIQQRATARGVIQRQLRSHGHPSQHGDLDASHPRAPGKVMGTMGVVYKDEGVKLRDQPAPGSRSQVLRRLPFNTRLYVAKELAGGWYEVTLETGEFGYVATTHVKVDLPEPGARLHKIKSGESAIGIAETYFKHVARWGEDLRFYVNALVELNQGPGTRGIYKPSGAWSWRDTETREGYLIWIPSIAFAKTLKGQVSSGSISYEAIQTAKRAAMAVVEFMAGSAAFIAGLLHGALESLWDVLVGVKDLAVMLWKILASLFRGELLSDAESLWSSLSKLDLSELVKGWISDFQSKWDHSNALKKWHFRGWVIGYAIMEIVLMFFSGGLINGIKWVAKSAKLAKILAKAPAVGRLSKRLSKVDLPPGADKAFKGAGKTGDAGKAAKVGKAARAEVIAEQTTRLGEVAHKLQAVRVGGRVQLWICSDCGSIVARIDEILAATPSKGPQKTLNTRLHKLRDTLVTLENDIDKGVVAFKEIPGKLNQIGAHLRDLSVKFPDVEELRFFRGFRAKLDFDGLASRLGYRRTNYRSHGQPVFHNGQFYITPDIDSHIGGVWKMADSVQNLGSKRTRMGTYDASLNRIGD